jgi:hypothetical protein
VGNILEAVGDSGTMLFSTDGGDSWGWWSWGLHNSLYGIAYGHYFTFVTVGASGAIITSSNGTVWTRRLSGTVKDLLGVAWADGKFITLGEADIILTSPDGVTWTLRASGTGVNINGVAFGNKTFVAVGDSGTVLTSPHGVNSTSKCTT